VLNAAKKKKKKKKKMTPWIGLYVQQNDNVLVNTVTFNAIIRACQEAGEVNKALEVFEWMIEGRGNSDRPVPADTETYNILIRCVHIPQPDIPTSRPTLIAATHLFHTDDPIKRESVLAFGLLTFTCVL
jgi:pentatricopeptide repeat protein